MKSRMKTITIKLLHAYPWSGKLIQVYLLVMENKVHVLFSLTCLFKKNKKKRTWYVTMYFLLNYSVNRSKGVAISCPNFLKVTRLQNHEHVLNNISFKYAVQLPDLNRNIRLIRIQIRCLWRSVFFYIIGLVFLTLKTPFLVLIR